MKEPVLHHFALLPLSKQEKPQRVVRVIKGGKQDDERECLKEAQNTPQEKELVLCRAEGRNIKCQHSAMRRNLRVRKESLFVGKCNEQGRKQPMRVCHSYSVRGPKQQVVLVPKITISTEYIRKLIELSSLEEIAPFLPFYLIPPTSGFYLSCH